MSWQFVTPHDASTSSAFVGAASVVSFASLLVLGGVAWEPLIDVRGALRLAPLAALVLVTATAKRRAIIACAAVSIAPAALVAAVPPASLVPTSWTNLGAQFVSGTRELVASSSSMSAALHTLPRAGIVVGLAVVWGAAAAVARGHATRSTRAVTLLLLAVPVVLSVLGEVSDRRSWLGAAFVAAALAWFRPRAVSRWSAALTIAAVAVAATSAAAVAGPQESWLPFGSHDSTAKLAIRHFDPTQTYGPLNGVRNGATLLRVRTAVPAYLRAEVLSRFDGTGWSASAQPESALPQPRARLESIEVSVRALVTNLAVSPGNVRSIAGAPATGPRSGDSFKFVSVPERGATYRVEADVTRASVSALAASPTPELSALARYRSVEESGALLEIPPLGSPIARDTEATLNGSSYARPLALARDLSRGATTQLDVVRNVEHYLAENYRYETEVRDGDHPLEDFLFTRRTGYCQHFSGAAALLLRLAGVPARVVTGFAPGVYDDTTGEWRVRDVDAHSWVEVYFQNVGWVTVETTPSAGPAAVPPGVDPLGQEDTPPTTSPADDTMRGVAIGAVSATVAVSLAGWAVLRRRRRRRGDDDTMTASILRVLAGRGAPLPVGATYAELRRALEESCGPETAHLAWVLETRQFSPSAATAPQVRVRAVRRALQRDRGLVRGSFLATRALRRGRRGSPRSRR